MSYFTPGILPFQADGSGDHLASSYKKCPQTKQIKTPPPTFDVRD